LQYLNTIKEDVDGLEIADMRLLKQKINESGLPFYIPRTLPKNNWTEIEYKKILDTDKINKINNNNLPIPNFICDLFIYLFNKAKVGIDSLNPNSSFSNNTSFFIHKFNKIKLRRDKDKCIKVSNSLSKNYNINLDSIDNNVITADNDLLTTFCGPLSTTTFRCRRQVDSKVKFNKNFDRHCNIKKDTFKRGGKKRKTIRQRTTKKMRNRIGGGPKNKLGICKSDICNTTFTVFITGFLVISIGIIIAAFIGIAIPETFTWGVRCILEPFNVIGSGVAKSLLKN
jgi:hypothetical protein